MGYTQRTAAPAKDDPHYSTNNPFHISGYGMPNCTCYAWGRAYEITGSTPKLSRSNAENWYAYSDEYQRGQTPMVGAIACWRKGKAGDSSDGAGHVAVVEQINADGSIITSESGHKSAAYWWRKVRARGNGNWGQGNDYVFQGFIYLPVATVSKTEIVVPTITGLPMLQIGSRGDTVKALQALLQVYGHDPGEIDGDFGRRTAAALIDYQKANSLSPDAICGNLTWHKLLGM